MTFLFTVKGAEMEIENILPGEIEKRSMEIIESELGDVSHLSESEKLVLKRVIHTTADFDYCRNLKFSADAAELGKNALKKIHTGPWHPASFLSGFCFRRHRPISRKAPKMIDPHHIVNFE